MKPPFLVPFLLTCSIPVTATESTGNDLSYDYYVESNKPIKCFYGYIADKTGDHDAAIKIFEDCIERWESVYAMIWLAQIYEVGITVEQDLEYATSLIKRGAELNDEAGYSSLARYHYGVALYEGKGVQQDKEEAVKWLEKSMAEGVEEAGVYLDRIGRLKP